MSPGMAARRSPKPGALTADLQAAARAVDDERRDRLALDVLGDDDQQLARLHHRFRTGGMPAGRTASSRAAGCGVLELGEHLLGVGDEVGRMWPQSNCMPSRRSRRRCRKRFCLLDRDHALVADLLHRLGDHRRCWCRRSPRWCRHRATSPTADLLGALDVFTTAATACRCRAEVHRVHAGRHRFCALAHDRGGESTVAVVSTVAGMSLVFWATSRTICAPMFSNLSRARSPWRPSPRPW